MRRVALVAALLLLAGCSQVAALAPVGGNRLTEVRFAALDVLVARHVELGAAPVCTMVADKTVTCVGRTGDGHPIDVVSTTADPSSMRVMVGGADLYSGSVQDVLDAASRPAS